MAEKVELYAMFNPPAPQQPIVFDENVCTGCNTCIDVCPMDVFIPNPGGGKPPVVLYPDECLYCGCCIMECPLWLAGAIALNHPVMQRARWKRKATGEHFRIGMPKPPPPSGKPPVGGWHPKV